MDSIGILVQVGFPSARCVTLDEAKAHLRVDHDLEDTLIEAYLDAAIASCADFAGRAFNQCQFRAILDEWPTCGGIELAIAPVVTVASLKYTDTDGQQQTIDGANWYWQKTPAGATVFTVKDFDLPLLYERPGSVVVDLEAGYDPPDYSEGEDPELKLPAQAKAAILLTVGHLYANRESVVVGKIAVELPRGARMLLDQIRIYR